MGQERFASKFCVLTRRGFAAILAVLQEIATRSGRRISAKRRSFPCAVLPLLRRELQPRDAHQQQGKEDQPGRRHRLLKGDDAHEHRAQRAAALSRHSRFMPG